MDGTLSNGTIKDEERPGWSMACPSCGKQFRYTVLNVLGGTEPFLYAERSADFVLRPEDSACVRERNTPTVDELRCIYDELESNLDECPNGGPFRRWANVKCPRCLYEFPYNNGVQSEATRYLESKIVWVEGAVAYRGCRMDSNRLAKVRVIENQGQANNGRQ